MKELDRQKVGNFKIEDAIEIGKLKENFNDEKFIKDHFLSVEELFREKQEIKLNAKEIDLLLNGVKITKKEDNDIYRLYDEKNSFIGIGIIENDKLKRDIIL